MRREDDDLCPIPEPSKELVKDLADAIHFALCFKVTLPMVGPRRARWKNDGESHIAADAIAKHIAMCNFRFIKGPPIRMWTTSDLMSPTKPED